jgi:predicted Zn-dependent protease
MKCAFALLFVFCCISIVGQTAPTQQEKKEQAIAKVCKGPEITSGLEFDELHRIVQRLGKVTEGDSQHKQYVALVDGSVINAWDVNLNMNASLICVPVSMVHFMGDAEGELAFIIAHETGHAVDDACKTQSGRSTVAGPAANRSALFGSLFAGSKGAAAQRQLAEQRSCESRADDIGFAIFTRAVYNPYDAAGAFGRLEMYLGDTSTGVKSHFLNAMLSNHPMTPDRINHMRGLLMNYALQNAATGQ